MEMGAKRLARKVASNVMHTPDEQVDISTITDARFEMRKRPFYLPEGVKRGVTTEEVFDSIKACYRRYGIKLLVFDNLHFLVRSSQNLREKIGEVSQEFKLLAEELRIPIILIVHPRKLNNHKRAMTADDFRETGTIHADADQVVILHRERNRAEDIENDAFNPDEKKDSILSPYTDVIVDASRFTQGGKTTLYYEGALSKYRSLKPGES